MNKYLSAIIDDCKKIITDSKTIAFWIYSSAFFVFLFSFADLSFFKESPNIYIIYGLKFLKHFFIPLLIYSGIGFFLGFLKGRILSKDIRTLEEKNSLLNENLSMAGLSLKDNSNDILRRFSQDKLSSDEGEFMRISLYVKNKEGGLTCYSRFSKHQKYLQRKGKDYDKRGIIGKVWEEGNIDLLGIFINDIPKYGDTKTEKDAYINYHINNYSLDKEYVENIGMKSRLYYVYRIDLEGEPLGVLSIESIDPNKYEKKDLDGLVPDFARTLFAVLKTSQYIMSEDGESYKNTFKS